MTTINPGIVIVSAYDEHAERLIISGNPRVRMAIDRMTEYGTNYQAVFPNLAAARNCGRLVLSGRLVGATDYAPVTKVAYVLITPSLGDVEAILTPWGHYRLGRRPLMLTEAGVSFSVN